MLFLLDFEKEFDFVTQDSLIVKQQLDKRKDLYSYEIVDISVFFAADGVTLKDKSALPKEYQVAIPIGSIQFVNAFLKIFFSIDREESIEIPQFMQTKEFLKREYKVVSYDRIPNSGHFFIKDISEQKSFSYIGDCSQINKKTGIILPTDHLYLCSEVVNIYSEYRVYVIDSQIKNISHYSGDPTILPDVELIKDAVSCYLQHDSSSTSFSIDFMVTDHGTAIIEIHSFMSLGLFWTKWDESLINAYIDSFRSLLKRQYKK